MWNIVAAAGTLVAGVIYYMAVGPALLPMLTIVGGGSWLLFAIIRAAIKRPT